MAWIAAIIGLVGAGVSAYSNSKRTGSGGGDPLAAVQAGIADDQYSRYKRLYAPREEQVLNSVFSDTRTPAGEAARAGAEATAAADNAEQISLRNARRQGISTSSPAYLTLERQSNANRAGLISSAKTYGRREADQVNFQRQMQVLGLGKNLPQTAIAGNQSAYDMYLQSDARRAREAQLQGDAIGQGIGYISSGLSDYLRGRNSNDGLDYFRDTDPILDKRPVG